MADQSDKGKRITINDSRFPIAVSGPYDPGIILAAAEEAWKQAAISTLCVSPSDGRCVVVLDTTGLDPESDEVIGICILERASEQIVYLNRFKPAKHASWREAQEVNGISPRDVESLGSLSESAGAIQGVIASHSGIVAYNAGFVAGFLRSAGLDLEDVPFTDTMAEYAGLRPDDAGNHAYVTLARAIAEIMGRPEEPWVDIAHKARSVSAVQSFLDTYHACIVERFCPEAHDVE